MNSVPGCVFSAVILCVSKVFSSAILDHSAEGGLLKIGNTNRATRKSFGMQWMTAENLTFLCNWDRPKTLTVSQRQCLKTLTFISRFWSPRMFLRWSHSNKISLVVMLYDVSVDILTLIKQKIPPKLDQSWFYLGVSIQNVKNLKYYMKGNDLYLSHMLALAA